jgi:hypothetical protein
MPRAGGRAAREFLPAPIRGKVEVMHEDDERQVDHDSTQRTQDGETQAPVVRLLANPRRTRRA